MEKLYTAKATVTGGRNGHVTTPNGILDVDVRMPKELGGPAGNYPNPELFFAAGYAACFDSALSMVIRNEKISGVGINNTTAEVSIGKDTDGGFGLSVVLTVEIPGVDKAVAEDLAHKAHQVCPYSKATRNNIDVQVIVK
ncbi:peroxiredoxin, Ohr subfamily [Chitinophaga costaii]|uniref:Peroxiredoxin, Ohr subfamily n=1 Tax=Chitinophaga costaii TaxID=1335309 RepID=A0A1C4F7B1_9BACT|nr:organic hydroperoxide resistance protein [Chitinophaga costaii]PUZ21211.1 organic hydroperoxide resistance protein [Chitinophaga costaii]SCC51919.1 peroxiredoxin, Ohr subfamily [Chitinophaga costaii]